VYLLRFIRRCRRKKTSTYSDSGGYVLEQALQKKILNWLDKQGYWTVKVITCNKNGTNDILACSPTGRFISIEVKREGLLHTVSKLQQYQIDRINEIGGVAFAADSLDMVKEVLNEHEDRANG